MRPYQGLRKSHALQQRVGSVLLRHQSVAAFAALLATFGAPSGTSQPRVASPGVPSLQCRRSESEREKGLEHPSHNRKGALEQWSVSWRLRSCARAKDFPHPAHVQTNGRCSACDLR